MSAEVTHVSPALFGSGGVLGGGERYALELARAMGRLVATRLVTFGSEARRFRDGRLEVAVLPARARWKGHDVNPLSERLPLELGRGRVIHAHQYESVVTNVCLLEGRALGKRVCVTHHGGNGRNYARFLRLHRLVDAFLAVSRFSAGFYPELAGKTSVVFGGADVSRFFPDSEPRGRQVAFVGRLLPHKGVDVLLEAVDPSIRVQLVGRAYDAAYRAVLEGLAAGKQVAFRDAASDEEVAVALRRSRVAVLPSVYRTPYGKAAPNSELLGLALLEAMACGTPVVCTDVGGMPEIVADGVTGFIVPPNDPVALRERISELLCSDALWRRMSVAAVEHVRASFTWKHVAERCLAAYDRGS